MTHKELITQMLKSLEWFVDHEMTVGQRYTNEGQQVLDNITAAREYLAAPEVEPVAEDLAMMVRRLVLSIRRLAEDDSKDLTFANTCLDWLKHKGLAGSPLRDTHPAPEAKQTVNQQLLEALKNIVAVNHHDFRGHEHARAALETALSEKQGEVAGLEDELQNAAISWCDSNGINALEPEQLASLVNSLYVTMLDHQAPAAKLEPVEHPEDRYVREGNELDCLCCGGSGHKDDAATIEPVGEVESSMNGCAGFHVRLGANQSMPKRGTNLYTHPAPSVNAQLLEALKMAEAALSDIGDADREPGDDVAWCEARAAKAIPAARATIAAAEGEK